jgi:DNA-binding MarR family transcriptional regulator
MSKQFYDQNGCLGFMTFTTSRLLSACLRKEMVKTGLDLTSEQWGVLMQFWNNNQLSQEEFTQNSCLDKSSVSRALAVMEQRGLIIRQTNPDDTRRKDLRLSDKAEAMKERALAAVKATIKKALEDVSPKDRQVCLKVLEKVKKNLKKK